MTVYLLALGSNITLADSTPTSIIGSAIEAICTLGQSRAVSQIYRTPAFPAGSGPDYANAAMALESSLTPLQLLQAVHRIEAEMGRERKVRWGARTLDIDIIAAEDAILPDLATQTAWRDLPLDAQMRLTPSEMILPHPRLQDRAFVLVPLAAIAPQWVHPVLEQTTLQMRDALPPQDLAEVTLW